MIARGSGYHIHDDGGPTCRRAAGRFFLKVAKTAACWEWTAQRDRDGYGIFRFGGHTVRAHRWAYEHLIGPIPGGLPLDHACRNRACVNPAHLEPVTDRTNILRGIAPTAINARKTHCIHGHEFTPENTRMVTSPSGHPARSCRACEKAKSLRWFRKNRATKQKESA